MTTGPRNTMKKTKLQPKKIMPHEISFGVLYRRKRRLKRCQEIMNDLGFRCAQWSPYLG
jgi:hypothetical protein